MFYAHFVLSKKGPLAKVWLAAHWDKKLTKSHVFETDVAKTVDDIISPKVKMALRTSGHLLLGVVRIYSRKQKYLIQDLGEACAKIKMAFRPGIVDLPAEGTIASGDTITLPEIFQNFELAVQDLALSADNIETDRFQSRIEDITLRDDHTSNRMFTLSDFQPMDNEFGGMLEDIELPRRASHSFQSHASDSSHLAPNDNTNTIGNNLMDVEKQFQNRPLEFGDMGGFGDGNMGLQEDLLVLPPLDANVPQLDINFDTSGPANTTASNAVEEGGEGGNRVEPMEVDTIVIPPQEETIRDEGYVLEPLDVTSGLKVRQKRKRKLAIDKEKELHANFIRAQLKDASNTMRELVYTGPKRKALEWKETLTAEYLYHAPTIPHLSSSLSSLVTCNQTQLSPSDVKAFEKALLTDGAEIPRENNPPVDTTANDAPGTSIIQPEDGEQTVMMMMDQNELDMMNQDVPLPTGGMRDEEEETVQRIIPILPDLEDPGITQPTDGETPQEDSTPLSDPTGEKRRWNKRTQQVVKLVDKCFEQTDTIHFSDLTRKCNRKQAASRFYSCLLLGKEGTIKLQQKEPYSAIVITKL